MFSDDFWLNIFGFSPNDFCACVSRFAAVDYAPSEFLLEGTEFPDINRGQIFHGPRKEPARNFY
jgi:hypothetical protein